MGSHAAVKRSRQHSRSAETRMSRQAQNPSPRAKRREDTVEEAPANLLRLYRGVEQRELRTVDLASFAPLLSGYERWQALNAAAGTKPAKGESRGRDTQAFLAFDDEKLSEPMRSRLMEPLNHAGLRGHVANPAEYGPIVTRVLRVQRPVTRIGNMIFGWPETQQLVVSGPLSAIHRHFPDAETRKSWESAGIIFGTGEMLTQMELY